MQWPFRSTIPCGAPATARKKPAYNARVVDYSRFHLYAKYDVEDSLVTYVALGLVAILIYGGQAGAVLVQLA